MYASVPVDGFERVELLDDAPVLPVLRLARFPAGVEVHVTVRPQQQRVLEPVVVDDESTRLPPIVLVESEVPIHPDDPPGLVGEDELLDARGDLCDLLRAANDDRDPTDVRTANPNFVSRSQVTDDCGSLWHDTETTAYSDL